MLDDVQLGYYDSDVKTFILRGLKSEYDTILQEDATLVFGHVNRGMKYRAMHLKQRFNHTEGGYFVLPETVLQTHRCWVFCLTCPEIVPQAHR